MPEKKKEMNNHDRAVIMLWTPWFIRTASANVRFPASCLLQKKPHSFAVPTGACIHHDLLFVHIPCILVEDRPICRHMVPSVVCLYKNKTTTNGSGMQSAAFSIVFASP